MGVSGVEMIWPMVGTTLLLALVSLAMRALEWCWLKPRRMEKALRAQGLKGSPYRFLTGDLKENARLTKRAESQAMAVDRSPHSVIPRVVPSLFESADKYGKVSFTWFGPIPQVSLTDPELIRELMSNKLGHFEKPKLQIAGRSSGRGLATLEGEKWVKHRRIINPAFHMEKLKRMLPAFSACCSELISRWENLVGAKGSCEIDISPELQNFTGDVISRTAFGSNFEEGRRIFQRQGEHTKLFMEARNSFNFPGYRFLPTSRNKQSREIDQEVTNILTKIIERREKEIKAGVSNNDDLLGLLLESNMKEAQAKSGNYMMNTDDVIGECKLFYFAGQETTSLLLTWTMIVLSMHPTWQVRAREEVLEVFGRSKPDFEGLSRLKIVTMILNEVLRLYTPLPQVNRRTYKTMKLGGITYPEGVMLSLPLIFVHHDPEYWGEDADKFNPERFAGGISKASKDQMAFFPFGWGPRICIGQNFAMIEAKMGLSMILQHFEFELSPSYVHAPHIVIMLRPQFGAPIVLRKL